MKTGKGQGDSSVVMESEHGGHGEGKVLARSLTGTLLALASW